MKRLFCLLVFIGVLIGTANGQAYVYFNEPSVNLSTETVTSLGDNHYFYSQQVIWHDAAGGELALENQVDNDFIVEVRTTGDIEILEGYYASKSGNNYEMGCVAKGTSNANHKYDIHFKGNRGTIIVNATNPDYYGSVYTGSYTINFQQSVTLKKWDFFSSPVTVNNPNDGKWKTMNLNGTTIHYWHHQFNGETNESNGPNIPVATGIEFGAAQSNFGYANDDKPNRFIALKGSGSYLKINNLQKADRIKIKMGKHGESMHLGISNASDALGKNITTDYVIGGCQWKEGRLNGEYHFQVNNNGTFQINVNTNDWLYIYSIEVYRSDEMISENSVLGTSYMLLNQEGSNTPAAGTYYLHYYGKGERTRIDPNSITTTGTVTCNNFTTDDNKLNYSYTSTVGQFGSFRMRLDCYDHSGNYCTDYAWRTETVGYMQNLSYPYTWDFTDAYTYINSSSNRISVENQYAAGTVNDNKNDNGRNLWETETDGYGLRLSPDAAHNFLFCGGSQLWCGKEIIPELKGLAFTPVNYDGGYNAALTLTSEGMKINQNIRDWWLWRIMIPSVPTNGVIYVRAKEIRDDSFCNVGYYHGNATNKTNKDLFNANADGTTNVARKFATSDGDVIYVVPAPSIETNVTLFFTGVIVKKISVSTDFKTVNKLGWATESRERVIDQELTSYFTDHEFKTYIVTGAENTNKTVTLQEVNTQNKVMKKTSVEGGQEAYVIRNMTLDNTDSSEPGRVKVLAGGFHLFVPDMHDYVEENENNETNGNVKGLQDMSSSLLKAQLGQGTVSQKGEGSNVYNYVLTTETASVDADGNENPRNSLDYVGFFRVQKNGVTSNGHQGYLPITVSGSTNAKYSIVFDNDWTVETPTGIVTPASNESINGKTIYYNLNGQRLNGQPSKGGIYIVNGKKVILK